MKKFLIITCAALLLTAGGLFAWARSLQTSLAECRRPHPPAPEVLAGPADPIAVPRIDTYYDEHGAQHTVVDATLTAEINQEAVRHAKPIADKMDSIAAAVGIKARDLAAYTATQWESRGDSLRFFKRKADSLGRQTYYYKDKYLTAAFRAAAAGDDSAAALASSSFDFSYNADLKFTDYTKRRRFLGIPVGRRYYYTDISSSDPRLKIKGVEKLTLQRRVPALGFRLQALAGYNFDTRANTLGAGVRFDVGDRFNTGLNYTYNFLLRDWAPTVYAKYDLIQLGR